MKVKIFVRSTEHRKVKIYVVGLLGWAPPHSRKTRLKSWDSKNSVHDGIKFLLAEKFNKIDVINLLISFYLEVLGLTSKCSQ
ncbi:hypothetical protein T02_2667 [Trichinella nativa]|uniref:Uncharacterized protein n=1 Tax=Trichinella nativa TaxID=6335 RepID=A0A0V1KT34_9BILA|nr:hypothetical protein T06_59 [Trichinella sp. T6]KRZ50263.1 hypothetical protein T02_2667 [Trichinella nativa]